MVCPKCLSQLRPIGEPRCKKCGKAISREEEELCMDCERGSHAFEEGRGIFIYDDKMRVSMVKYKEGGRREYGDFFSRAMISYGKEELRRWRPEAVLSVPLHPRKLRMRGFDQAEYLAIPIAAKLGVPLCKGYLKKKSMTFSQKELGAAMRRRNLRDSFEGRKGDWAIRRLLVVDDVYTTGSTIDAVSQEAKKHGVEKVFFLTVCIGSGA